MSKRVVSDSTGLYRLNIVSKDKTTHSNNQSEERQDQDNRPSTTPVSPRRTALKINFENEEKDSETEKEIMTKIAKVEEEILQCESRLSTLNQELKNLQEKLRPVIANPSAHGENKEKSINFTEKGMLSSPSSKWKQFKENGSSLLQKFKEYTINDEQESEYDDILAKNKHHSVNQFAVKDGLNYEYDSDTDLAEDSE